MICGWHWWRGWVGRKALAGSRGLSANDRPSNSRETCRASQGKAYDSVVPFWCAFGWPRGSLPIDRDELTTARLSRP